MWKKPRALSLYVHQYELYLNYMLLPAGEFCSGLEQREQATGTEYGTVKMSIGMSGSKVPRNVIRLLVHLSVLIIKKEKRRIFSYFTDAYPLANTKSISLHGLRLVLKPTKLLEPYFIVFTCSWRPSWQNKHGPTGSFGKMTSKLHSAVTQRPMIYVLQTLHGCERDESPISGRKWSCQEILRNKCTTVAAVKDDKKMKQIPTKMKGSWHHFKTI